MIAYVYYCGQCRKIIRALPRHALAKSCTCDMPEIGQPTLITWEGPTPPHVMQQPVVVIPFGWRA